MIEAVNSALANGPVLKAAQEQASQSVNYAAAPAKVQDVAIAPYISPKVRMDNDSNKAVLEFRSQTGDLIGQTPSEQQLQAYRKSTSDSTIDVRDAQAARVEAPAGGETEAVTEV